MLAFENTIRIRVLENIDPNTQPIIDANDDVIGNRRINANESIFSDRAKSGNNSVRGDKAVVLDHRMMADVVSAPKHDVIANFDEWLDRIIFKDKAVFAQNRIRPYKCPATDITRWPIPLRLRFLV